MLVENNVTVITGGASGIGEATARKYAEHGASVVVADIDASGGRATVDEIVDEGGEATFVETDVSQAAEVKEMIETAVDTYDGLDVLFNNAGIAGGVVETAELDETEFDELIGINFRSVFLGMKYGIQAMLADGGGSIINTSSAASEVGALGKVNYAGAKAGVNGMTRVAAAEYAEEGIRVNSILPGVVETPMVQREREAVDGDLPLDDAEAMPGLTESVEVANVVLFLGSDLSSRVTGVQIPVDGGMLASP